MAENARLVRLLYLKCQFVVWIFLEMHFLAGFEKAVAVVSLLLRSFRSSDNTSAGPCLADSFLEQRDLTGVIQAVLHNPMEEVIEIVLTTGNSISQAVIGEAANGCG